MKIFLATMLNINTTELYDCDAFDLVGTFDARAFTDFETAAKWGAALVTEENEHRSGYEDDSFLNEDNPDTEMGVGPYSGWIRITWNERNPDRYPTMEQQWILVIREVELDNP